MSARHDGKSLAPRRRPDRRTMAAISPLPPPNEVFADWLMSVPAEDCLEAAARYQIEIIDRSAFALHPHVRQLRTLLVAVAGDCDWRKPVATAADEDRRRRRIPLKPIRRPPP